MQFTSVTINGLLVMSQVTVGYEIENEAEQHAVLETIIN